MTTDTNDYAIVSAIISLAQQLGMKTIAEGVETQEQLTMLQELACDEMQGYYLSKPLPSTDFQNNFLVH
ncbi:Oxygen sensor protein DosP [Marinomonas spartinae]|uniref:EAL domain-containing protein n=1 Tax=Marinomonas spartinae TaxID=1792290 RepID=UPI000808F182|nr:EAL domain-containing protein [Marinomonas spartinae]SBS32538.1 Oxygen sensor protein DosP [Marinomonas spartinae]